MSNSVHFFSRHVETKAAYEASRPTESTYKVDETDEVFNTLPTDSEDEGNFSELLKAVFKISEGIFILVQSTKKMCKITIRIFFTLC